MLFNCIKFASGQVMSTDEKGRELKELNGRFDKVKDLLKLYGLKNTRWYYRSETKCVQVTEEEFFRE